jgi:uncharacterized protein (DUF952 family)
MDLIFHITSRHEAEEATLSGTYVPRDFEREGFVHCSYRHQLAAVADRLFRGRTDLVVLQIDPSRLTTPVIHENLEGGTELFPHVYGPIPMAAIVEIHPLHT